MKLSLRSALTLSAGLLLAQGAHAFDYQTDKPLMFIYQNNNQYWFSCGPVQCNSVGTQDKEEATDLVTHDTHGTFEVIGYYGRCTVMQGDGELPSYDLQTSRIAELIQKRCSQQ